MKRIQRIGFSLAMAVLMMLSLASPPALASGEDTPPAVETEKTLTKEKTVVEKEDGTYDLTLGISGAVGNITKPVPIDILLIVDRSGSMGFSMSEDEYTSSPDRRIDKAADAVSSLVDAIAAKGSALDVRYDVVAFSSASITSCRLTWSGDGELAKTTVKNITPQGGTNYQKGIYEGKIQLASARQEADKVVIFLTDGIPTLRGTSSGTETGSGNSDVFGLNIAAAETEIRSMQCDAFYAVGAGPDFSDLESTGVSNLSRLCSSVGTGTGAVPPQKTAWYAAGNTSALNKAFTEIAANTTSVLCDHVTVRDVLSENVTPVMEGDSTKQPLVRAVTSDGTVLEGTSYLDLPATGQNAAFRIQAGYEAGVLTLSFPSDYKLEPGWNYQAVLSVIPTQKAYEKYREQGLCYTDTADPGTGTYAEQTGFFSNVSAEVTYTYNGEEKTESYPFPVVRLHPGTLILEKHISGIDPEGELMSILFDSLTFQVTLDGSVREISIRDFRKDEASGNFIYRLEGLSPGTSFEVAETNAELPEEYGYYLSYSGTNTQGCILPDGEITASMDNHYEFWVAPPTGLGQGGESFLPISLLLLVCLFGAAAYEWVSRVKGRQDL